MSSSSPKSTIAEHGSAQDSPENGLSNNQTTSSPPEAKASTSIKRQAPMDEDRDGKEDHPAHRYAGTIDAHEEFRAVGRPTKMTRRESKLAHIAAAQKEIEKADEHLRDTAEDDVEGKREGEVKEKRTEDDEDSKSEEES